MVARVFVFSEAGINRAGIDIRIEVSKLGMGESLEVTDVSTQ